MRLKAEIQAFRVERQSINQQIEEAKDYVSNLEQAIIVCEKEFESRRKELARRFASYDSNFKQDAMLDPSLLN